MDDGGRGDEPRGLRAVREGDGEVTPEVEANDVVTARTPAWRTVEVHSQTLPHMSIAPHAASMPLCASTGESALSSPFERMRR